MIQTDADIVARVMIDEGGLTDNPADPGGVTHYGVTIPAWTDYLRALSGNPKAQATAEDIRSLTEDNAATFYRWLLLTSGIAKIQNVAVRYAVFDAAVNIGNKPAIRLLQRALRIDDDGVIGPVTLAAVPHLDGSRLAVRACVEQLAYYGRLASGNLTDRDHDGKPDNLEFLPGWLARLGRKIIEVTA